MTNQITLNGRTTHINDKNKLLKGNVKGRMYEAGQSLSLICFFGASLFPSSSSLNRIRCFKAASGHFLAGRAQFS